VSAQASARDLKAAPRSEMLAKTFRRSLVDLASRSSLVTSSTSPLCRAAIALARALRSVTAPLIFSLNIRLAPEERNASSWLSPTILVRPGRGVLRGLPSGPQDPDYMVLLRG
jgi:hypothetical protein